MWTTCHPSFLRNRCGPSFEAYTTRALSRNVITGCTFLALLSIYGPVEYCYWWMKAWFSYEMLNKTTNSILRNSRYNRCRISSKACVSRIFLNKINWSVHSSFWQKIYIYYCTMCKLVLHHAFTAMLLHFLREAGLSDVRWGILMEWVDQAEQVPVRSSMQIPL